MTSYKPYLLRAMHQWVQDNNHTTGILINPYPGLVRSLEELTQELKRANGHCNQKSKIFGLYEKAQVILRLYPDVVKDLVIGGSAISFIIEMGGVTQKMSVPLIAITSIYALETGEGLATPYKPPSLTVVK